MAFRNSALHVCALNVDITPERPVALGGFTGRLGPYRAINDALSLSGVALRQGDARALIFGLDTLFVSDDFRDNMLAALAETGHHLAADQLFICASHTHFAPMLDATKPLLGAVDSVYRSLVLSRAVDMARELLDSPGEAATIRCRFVPLKGGIGRRSARANFADGAFSYKTIMAPNELAAIDKMLGIVRFDRSDGQPLALLWNWACHPVGFPDLDMVSADYPGVVRAALADTFGGGAVAIYLPGFGGDVRPEAEPDSGRGDIPVRFCGVRDFKPFDREAWTTWAQTLGRQVADAAMAGLAADGTGWTKIVPDLGTADRIVALHQHGGEPAAGPMSMRLLRLGRRLALTFWGSEPVSGYAARIRSRPQDCAIIPVGYQGQVFGYMPTDAMISGGGYEVEGFSSFFNWDGAHYPGIEQTVLETFEALLSEAGIPLKSETERAETSEALGWEDTVRSELDRFRSTEACATTHLLRSTAELAEARRQRDELLLEASDLKARLISIETSRMWTMLAPLRRLAEAMKARSRST